MPNLGPGVDQTLAPSSNPDMGVHADPGRSVLGTAF